MATCPSCGTKSREDPTAMTVEEVLVAKPVGTFSLAGVGMKFSAAARLKLACRCGWSVLGHIEGDHFVADDPICATCGHPAVVHGGFARPDGSCGYRGCKCTVLVAS